VILGLLAILSASAAAGMRIALPLLVLGLLHSEQLWSNVPLLSRIHPQVVLSILISWSLFELFGSKNLLGQRVLQSIELIFSPFVGALMGIAVLNIIRLDFQPVWLIGALGGLLALVLKLVQIGWFFRLRGLPIWMVCIEDILCVCLVLLALNAPEQGGIIAMFLLWIAVRSSQEWRRWYTEKKSPDV
jgi:Domain of unknown function (DUF4126)